MSLLLSLWFVRRIRVNRRGSVCYIFLFFWQVEEGI